MSFWGGEILWSDGILFARIIDTLIGNDKMWLIGANWRGVPVFFVERDQGIA